MTTTLPWPILFADFTTEGGTNQYFFGQQFAGSAAWLSAISGNFQRSSTAYYTNSAGTLTQASNNIPRFDYNPITLVNKGLLLEPPSTNIALQSQALATSPWNAANSNATNNAAVAPDGTSTASSCVPNASNSEHATRQDFTSVAASYSWSAYVKASGYSKVGFREEDVTGDYATFSLSGAGSVLDTNKTASITQLANGWYRVVMKRTGTAGTERMTIFVLDNGYTTGDPSNRSYSGDGVSGLLLWGVQIERLFTDGVSGCADTSSYIPTTAGTASRSGEIYNLGLAGGPAIAAFDALPFTLFVNVADMNLAALNSYGPSIFANDNATFMLNANGSFWFSEDSNSNVLAAPNTLGLTSGTVAVSYQAGRRIICASGGTIATDTFSVVPASFDAVVGGNGDATDQIQGHIAQVALFNIGLTGTQLQALTSGSYAFAYGPLVETTLSRVPARAFTRKHYEDLLEEIREEVIEEREAIGALDERGLAERNFEVAQRMLNELENNLTPTNYAKMMDARERLEAARKSRDHHYFMEIVNKEWAKHSG